jgi:hypothetical protein
MGQDKREFRQKDLEQDKDYLEEVPRDRVS